MITAKIREEIKKQEFPQQIFRLTNEDYTKKIKSIYQSVAKACLKLQEKVGNYEKDRAKLYKEKEEKIKTILSDMPTAEEIEKILSFAEIDMKEFYNLYSEQKVKDAILYAKDLKDRYTVLWLYYDLFSESL